MATHENLPAPTEGLILTHFLTVRDVDVSRRFYADIFGGQVVLEENPAIVSKGAQFLTEPLDRKAELRCYLRDPDGYLIEVGQATGMLEGIFADTPAKPGQ